MFQNKYLKKRQGKSLNSCNDSKKWSINCSGDEQNASCHPAFISEENRPQNNPVFLLIHYVASGLITGIMQGPSAASAILRRHHWLKLPPSILSGALVLGMLTASICAWIKYRKQFAEATNCFPYIAASLVLPVSMLITTELLVNPLDMLLNMFKWFGWMLVVICVIRAIPHHPDKSDDK